MDTTKLDGDLLDRKWAPSYIETPSAVERSWVNPQALDLFEVGLTRQAFENNC